MYGYSTYTQCGFRSNYYEWLNLIKAQRPEFDQKSTKKPEKKNQETKIKKDIK